MKTNIRMKEILAARATIRARQYDADFARKYKPGDLPAAFEAIRRADANLDRIAEPLSAAIREAEGRATERCLTARAVVLAIESITENLKIPASRMRGIKATVCPAAQDFPRAYKYTPKATTFCIEYKSTGWVVTDISRTACPRASQEYYIELTEDAKAAIIDRIIRNR